MLERAKHFSIKQLAAQAGMSKATVDRVLHQRGSVHYQTQRRVEQALAELEAQERNGLVVGRTFHIDVIMHTPRRFSAAVQSAIEAQLGSLAPFRIAPRFYFFEEIEPQAMHDQLMRCIKRGSQGVVLKAADEPLTLAAVKALKVAGIPVVTLVTDLPHSERIGYVGIDNRAAGQTAAYLLSRWLGDQPQDVAVVIGSEMFRGEEEREMGFRNALRGDGTALRVVEISGGFGVYERTFERVIQALEIHPGLRAVYSVGGGNRAIVDAFASVDRALSVLIGHDLDEENRQLLTEGRMTALINHDLLVDAGNVLTYILQYHGLWRAGPIASSAVQIVTPYNLPY
ncbi:LacI family DNA-binding transcriptional regulator [Pseudomonas syringae]|uniref:LacI family DNA-binding transcriptional regulator n=1 Tax=Pseudomonas syringae TaxID=317 RepID=UPI00137276A8|nr:LacI family DNA-binding transcriptional regulator [Pseudomonas syringae]MDU8432644.1 LacI family DNA-binding transcriptional regulator [Pseudomonas syringae pv. actinidifoliorum]MDU8523517.1 LacI family DNA-binding transcriptional regulator [Pseudomonas syringae pv. actinidifoliorum]MDU8529509.1 LacI family DNA-binding transcriptional regulator [Pseudomonas syringae pv. actinidifoliorum]NAS96168.1 LacI family transcriptional regulator [Pseudomonas syringae pv. actinidifoliorum]NAT22880.1 La